MSSNAPGKIMLTREQLGHFANHGWVIRKRVFGAEFIDTCRRVMDETAATQPAHHADDETVTILGLVNHHELYRDLLLHPMLLENSRQLMGTDLTHRIAWMIIKKPHPERHQKRNDLTNPKNLGWHRDMRPKWGTFADDQDPGLVNCLLINCMVAVTDIGPDDGGTMALDGSHKIEGDPESLLEKCPLAQLEAPRGSVIYFPETLMHSAVPILSEATRYVLFFAFVPPWFKVWQNCDVRQEIVDSYDGDVRSIVGGNDGWGYPGQHPIAADDGS